jgi:hypothetical protein
LNYLDYISNDAIHLKDIYYGYGQEDRRG